MNFAPSSYSNTTIFWYLIKLVCRITPVAFFLFLVVTCASAILLSAAPFLFPNESNATKLLIYGLVLCCGMLLSKIGNYTATYLDNKAYKFLSLQMFAAALYDSKNIANNDSAAVLNKNEQAAESASVLLHSFFASILPFLLQVGLVCTIAANTIGISIGILLAMSALIQSVLSIYFAKRLGRIQKSIINAEADAYSNASEVFSNIKTITSLRIVDVFTARFSIQRGVYEKSVDDYNFDRVLHDAAQVAVIAVVIFLSFYLLNFSIGLLITINFIVLLIVQGFQSIGNDFIAVNDSLVKFKASGAALRLLENPVLQVSEEKSISKPSKLSIRKYVNLGYTLKAPFEIQSPALVVLTGASGIGKTTMLEAVAYIRENKEWDIRINENKVSSLTQKQLADIFSFAYHDTDIFMDSLQFNITLSDINAPIDVLRYQRLVATLGLEHLQDMECHPNMLSSGEKLRIGLARALYREKPIYMLDEPTASLDTNNISAVLNIISELKENHLVICTSHDARLIALADVQLDFQDASAVNALEILASQAQFAQR